MCVIITIVLFLTFSNAAHALGPRWHHNGYIDPVIVQIADNDVVNYGSDLCRGTRWVGVETNLLGGGYWGVADGWIDQTWSSTCRIRMTAEQDWLQACLTYWHERMHYVVGPNHGAWIASTPKACYQKASRWMIIDDQFLITPQSPKKRASLLVQLYLPERRSWLITCNKRGTRCSAHCRDSKFVRLFVIEDGVAYQSGMRRKVTRK